jgi:hypothetical protein
MLTFRSGAGALVASDTQNAVAAMDDALLNGLRMYTTVIEATKGSNLPIGQSQKLYAGMSTGLSQMLAGRADLVDTVRLLVQIKDESNFAPENYGCPDGWVPAGASKQAETALTTAG